MSGPRNYASEYARRIERAMARGLSRSQARGHAKAGEATLGPAKGSSSVATLEAAVKSMHRNGSLQAAARFVHVSPERLRRYLSEQGLALRQGGTWQFTDNRMREMKAYVDGQYKTLRLNGFESSSLNGEHLNAVKRFLEEGDGNGALELLAPFIGKTITDAKGRTHIFETDPNTLYRIAGAGGDVFEQIYRLIL